MDLPEFRTVIHRDRHKWSSHLSDDVIEELFKRLDSNGNGLIEVDEFLAWFELEPKRDVAVVLNENISRVRASLKVTEALDRDHQRRLMAASRAVKQAQMRIQRVQTSSSRRASRTPSLTSSQTFTASFVARPSASKSVATPALREFSSEQSPDETVDRLVIQPKQDKKLLLGVTRAVQFATRVDHVTKQHSTLLDTMEETASALKQTETDEAAVQRELVLAHRDLKLAQEKLRTLRRHEHLLKLSDFYNEDND